MSLKDTFFGGGEAAETHRRLLFSSSSSSSHSIVHLIIPSQICLYQPIDKKIMIYMSTYMVNLELGGIKSQYEMVRAP